MSDFPTESSVKARLTRRWMLGAAILAVVGLISVFAINMISGGSVDEATSADFTAWQSRRAMEQVMTETAASIGLTIQPRDPDNLPLGCDLAGGGQGSSFLVNGFEGPPIPDLDASLAKVRAAWEAKGWVVHNRAIEDARGLSTTLPDGGSFYMISGTQVTIIAGESGCARTVGDPTEAPSN